MEENRKHHSFRKGLICGVLISVLTVSVCGCGAAWMLGHLGLTALTSGGNAEEQAKISTKMQELQSYIDRFYLFDYDEENVESGIYKGMMGIPTIIHRKNMQALWSLPTEATAESVPC